MDTLELIAAIIRSASFTITGNIGTEPAVQYFQSGTCVCNFSVAVNRPNARRNDGQKPDWFRVECWGEEGQAMADTLNKGDRVTIRGRIRTERYTSKQTGEDVVSLVIRADEWHAGDKSPTVSAAPPAPATPTAPAPAAKPPVFQSNGGADFSSDEIPF